MVIKKNSYLLREKTRDCKSEYINIMVLYSK